MEVRASNFPEKLKDIQARLAQAAFVAIDLELTGVNAGSENYADFACERLETGCRIVECYAPIQLGITICSNDRELASYKLASYNIMTAPESTLLCDISALKFLRHHNVDLNLWVDEGVRYVSREEANSQAETPMHASMYHDFHGLLHEQHELAAGSSSLCQAAQLRAKRREGVDLNAWVEEQGSEVWHQQDTRRFSVSAVRDDREVDLEDLERRKAGLPKLWQSIKDARKPLIIHSGFKDVLFLLAAFEKRVLPRDPRKLADLVQECFPAGIQDTAYLHETIEVLRLQPLRLQDFLRKVRELYCKQHGSDLHISFEKHTRERYGNAVENNDTDELAHEAGFDSLLTAVLYSYLKELFTQNWQHCRNRFYLHKSTDTIGLRVGEEMLFSKVYDQHKLVVAELGTPDARENTAKRISEARRNDRENSFFYRKMDDSSLLIPGCNKAQLVKLSSRLPGVNWTDFYTWQNQVRVKPKDMERRFTGHIKSFNEQRNFGFIASPDCSRTYGVENDVFLHRKQALGFKDGQHVSFQVELNNMGKPQARELRVVSFSGIIRSIDPDNPHRAWICSPSAYRVFSCDICWHQDATDDQGIMQVGDQVDFSIIMRQGQPYALPLRCCMLEEVLEFASV